MLFIFRERGREGERGRETSMCGCLSYVTPTGDLAYNPGVCPDWESNQQPFGSQAGAQSTAPPQPGLPRWFLTDVEAVLWQRDSLPVAGLWEQTPEADRESPPYLTLIQGPFQLDRELTYNIKLYNF